MTDDNGHNIVCEDCGLLMHECICIPNDDINCYPPPVSTFDIIKDLQNDNKKLRSKLKRLNAAIKLLSDIYDE